jgi:enamine deaminase RidA (YjgF/YER057c/UK114 family)
MAEQRQRIASGTVWEELVGFSRALRAGRYIAVSGTTATDEQGQPVGLCDPAAQTAYIIEKIERALVEAGGGLEHVIRTRIYVTNADDWEAIGRVHGRYFAEVRPANTLIEVSGLVGDGYLVEIEADALLPDDEA